MSANDSDALECGMLSVGPSARLGRFLAISVGGSWSSSSDGIVGALVGVGVVV